MKPIDRFKIRLPYKKNNRFVEVIVWLNKTQLQKYCQQRSDVEGFFHPEPYKVHPKKYVPQKIGTLHFHTKRIGVGVIAHEVAHSAAHIFDVLGKDIVQKDNELFCHYIGFVVKEVCNRFIEKGYYSKKK